MNDLADKLRRVQSGLQAIQMTTDLPVRLLAEEALTDLPDPDAVVSKDAMKHLIHCCHMGPPVCGVPELVREALAKLEAKP